MASRGINIPEFSALSQFVDPMAQAGKFASAFSARKSAEESAALDRMFRDQQTKTQEEQWNKSFGLQEAANKRAEAEAASKSFTESGIANILTNPNIIDRRAALTELQKNKLFTPNAQEASLIHDILTAPKVEPISGTVSITSADGSRTTNIPYSQLDTYTKQGWVVGKKDKDRGSSTSGGSSGDSYNKMREDILDYGFLDKKEAQKSIDLMQSYNIDPNTANAALIKMKSDSLFDKTLTRKDLDKYLPKVIDETTGKEIGFGTATSMAESKGIRITMDDKGRYTLVNVGNKNTVKTPQKSISANNSLYNKVSKEATPTINKGKAIYNAIGEIIGYDKSESELDNELISSNKILYNMIKSEDPSLSEEDVINRLRILVK